jgi:uncharacterized repeat protein (TIGR01451 family)
MKIKTAMKKIPLATACTLLPFSTVLAQGVVLEREKVDQVRAGERFEYKVTITNEADTPVKDIKINEFVTTGEPGGEGEDGKLSTTVPYLEAGESKTFDISGIARKEGKLQSCLGVTYTPATCAEIDVVKPDISLACDMAEPNTPVPNAGDSNLFYACEPAVVTCTVTNEGSGASQESELMLNLPSDLSLEEGEATTTIGSIDPGAEEQYTFRINANNAGDYTLTPSLNTSQGTAEAQTINLGVVQPNLELAVQAPDQEFVSRPVAFAVHLRNIGDVAVTDAKLAIDSPDTLENLSISSEAGVDEEGVFEFETLAPGAMRTINIQGDAVEAGEASLVAKASGYCMTDIADLERTAAVKLEGVPALVLIAYDQNDPVAVGNETSYDIKVKNQGTGVANEVSITGELGEQFTFVEGTGDSTVTGSGTSFNFEPISKLEPGETVSWTISAQAQNAGYARLNLDMNSTATKRSITEQEPTRVIE